jgi:hypothetical protein
MIKGMTKNSANQKTPGVNKMDKVPLLCLPDACIETSSQMTADR